MFKDSDFIISVNVQLNPQRDNLLLISTPSTLIKARTESTTPSSSRCVCKMKNKKYQFTNKLCTYICICMHEE